MVHVALRVSAMPAARIRRGATAVIVVAHIHHRIHRRHPAALPQPGQGASIASVARIGSTIFSACRLPLVTPACDGRRPESVLITPAWRLAPTLPRPWPVPPGGGDDPRRAPRRTAQGR